MAAASGTDEDRLRLHVLRGTPELDDADVDADSRAYNAFSKKLENHPVTVALERVKVVCCCRTPCPNCCTCND
jgi:hypothetical protein